MWGSLGREHKARSVTLYTPRKNDHGMWSISNAMARTNFFVFAYDRQYEQGAQGSQPHCYSVLCIGESRQGAQGPRRHTLHFSGKELACMVDHRRFSVCDRQHPQGATRLTTSLLFCPSHRGVSARSTRPTASHFTP
jgi:hypothetical protein